MSKKLVISVVVAGLFLSGCAPTYSINPEYNPKEKTVVINKVEFDSVIQKKDKNLGNNMRGGGKYYIKDYILNEGNCKKIHYESSVAANKTYFTSSKYDKIISYNLGDSCDIAEISNLKSQICSFVKNKNKKYYITTDTSNEWGYQTVEKLDLGESCFVKIKNSIINESKKDKVEVKNYIDKVHLPKDTKVYIGEVKTSTTDSIVKILVDSSGKIKGRRVWQNKYNKKEGYEMVEGNLNKFESPWTTFTVTSVDGDVIEGSFKGTKKQGTFNLLLVK